jgi:hypothetical protein
MLRGIVAGATTGVALCALSIVIDAPAFARGGGGGGGGGGFHHDGFHGFAGHASAGHAFGGHWFGGGRVVSYGGRGSVGGQNRFGGANQFAATGQYAHHQFAAQHFQGLNNFNRIGFNRNTFGNRQGWNGWGGHFWGAGWNNWGSGWGGWAGPVFWPFLVGDIFSFAFWPYDYYDPFWAFGPDFVFASIFAPGPYFGLEHGYGPDFYSYEAFPNIYYGSGLVHVAKSRRLDREAVAENNAEALQSCGGLAPNVTDLPIGQIRQVVHPTAEQAAALDDLSAALPRAKEIVAESCPKTVPLTPLGRLDAAEQRLDVMIQAVQIVHSPVEKFYVSLSDDQRQRFLAMGNPRRGQQRSAAVGGNLASICSQTGSFTNLPVQRIQQVVEPNVQQQGVFDELKKASENAASRLEASCPTQMPQTPTARFDAVEKRLGTIVEAIKTVRPTLTEFYALLSDEQKARFNTMGPPMQNVSPQPQHQSDGRYKG